MKKKFVYLPFLFCILSGFVCGAASREDIKYLSNSFLDSLKVVIDHEQFARGEFVFRSETPVRGNTPALFLNYSTEESFAACIPINGRMYGLVSPPLDIFAGGRIALIYSIADEKMNNYELLPTFSFHSRGEGEIIRQELTLKFAGGNPVSIIRFTMFDIEIWEDNKSVRQVENNPPVLRRTLSFNQEQKGTYYVNYFYKDPQGVIKLTDFEDGADYSEPQFKGGAVAQYFHMIENIRFPEEAKEKGIGGTVLVNVTIDENGNVADATIFSGRHQLLNEEALRFVYSTSGMWIPAQKKGVNMKDRIMWPIQFDSGGTGIVTTQTQIIYPDGEDENETEYNDELAYIAETDEEREALMDEIVDNEPTTPGEYLAYLLCAVIVIFFMERLWNKLQEKKYTTPNSIPLSLYNEEALRLNETLENDTLIVVKGITEEDFKEYIGFAEEMKFHVVEPEVLVLQSEKRMRMDELCFLISLLNAFSNGDKKIKCAAWTTVPLVDMYGAKTVPGMFYTATEKNNEYVFLTTKDNSCYRINPPKLLYDPVVWKESYREPPYDYQNFGCKDIPSQEGIN